MRALCSLLWWDWENSPHLALQFILLGSHAPLICGVCEEYITEFENVVNVYSSVQPCPPNMWGTNCGKSCICNSNNTESCDPEDGSCNCKIGYQGATCDLSCSPGSFGVGCKGTDISLLHCTYCWLFVNFFILKIFSFLYCLMHKKVLLVNLLWKLYVRIVKNNDWI